VGFWKDLGNTRLPADVENMTSLELSNRSRIVALPGQTGDKLRGFSSPSLILVDEASRVSDDLIYGAIMPMLSVSEGRLIMLSTPFGKRGMFWEAWENGGDLWKRYKVTAYDCDRISKEWLESQRAIVGDWFFKQEALCEFCENVASLFSYDLVQAAVKDFDEIPFDLDLENAGDDAHSDEQDIILDLD